MEGHLWFKPTKVLSDDARQIQEEDATGRFHASLAFTRQVFEQVAGWPLTLRDDLDQRLISRLNSIGPAADPCSIDCPSYIFRWGSTEAHHGEAMMRGPDDEYWYRRVALLN